MSVMNHYSDGSDIKAYHILLPQASSDREEASTVRVRRTDSVVPNKRSHSQQLLDGHNDSRKDFNQH